MDENNTQLAAQNTNLSAIFGLAVSEQSVNDLFTAGVSTGDYLPQISIRGREFRTIVGGDSSRLLDRHLDVILVSARPNISKTFYAKKYAGSDEAGKPDCAAADGVTPDANIEHPVASTCQICPNNAWGSRITDNGKKGKACADSRLIVVAMASNPDMVFQMRIPATSLKPLAAYIKKISMMGIPADGAITRMTFADAEYPMLEFSMIGNLQTAAQYEQIKRLAARDDVQATIQTRTNHPVNPSAAALNSHDVPQQHAAIQPVVIQQPSPTVTTQTPFVSNPDPVVREAETSTVEVNPSVPESAATTETPKAIADILAKWGKS